MRPTNVNDKYRTLNTASVIRLDSNRVTAAQVVEQQTRRRRRNASLQAAQTRKDNTVARFIMAHQVRSWRQQTGRPVNEFSKKHQEMVERLKLNLNLAANARSA